MDPLSVSASVVGILGAAASVTSALVTFTKNTKNAPKLAQNVLSEVTGLSGILSQLQAFVVGDSVAAKSRTSLILVEQVIVTLTQCVTTFSELEEILGTSPAGADVTGLDRVKWAMKESKIKDILGRLQSDKSSLMLMLTILQCKSVIEAETAMDRLCNLIEQVLANNQAMAFRLRAIDEDTSPTIDRTDTSRKENDADSTSSVTSEEPTQPAPVSSIQRNAMGFAFEEELLASRVYKRPLFSESGESLATSVARTTATSILSALSLSDVSNISILAVPIYPDEIFNSHRYTFGNIEAVLKASKPSQSSFSEPSLEKSAGRRWGRFADAVRRGRRTKGDGSENKPDNWTPRVLGTPLTDSIKFANVAITLTDDEGKTFTYGYIPIYAAKIVIFLKAKGTDVEHIFGTSGSPKRLKELETIFDSPPGYGRGLDWTGYTVHDAANILVRFLASLPEPVIHVDLYERFQQPLRRLQQPLRDGMSNPFDKESAIAAYQDSIEQLQPLHLHLLLYLLDIFAVFASMSDLNKMTSARLAAIFQPVILSPVRKGEEIIEDPSYRKLSQDVLIFLIENLDNFLIGMKPISTYKDALVVEEVLRRSQLPKQNPDEASLQATKNRSNVNNLPTTTAFYSPRKEETRRSG